jgi:hypothetical protein
MSSSAGSRCFGEQGAIPDPGSPVEGTFESPLCGVSTKTEPIENKMSTLFRSVEGVLLTALTINPPMSCVTNTVRLRLIP